MIRLIGTGEALTFYSQLLEHGVTEVRVIIRSLGLCSERSEGGVVVALIEEFMVLDGLANSN